ncbi:hypothetical protein ACFX15_023694 [Malus domestica]
MLATSKHGPTEESKPKVHDESARMAVASGFRLDDSRKNGATTVGTEDEFRPANSPRTSLIAQASIGGSEYSISSTDS